MTTLFTVPRFLSSSECAALITETERRGFVAAPVTTARGFVMMPEVRNNTRVIVDDMDLAARLWARLRAHPALAPVADPSAAGDRVPFGLNERFRFYRYEPGQAFRWHRDGAFHRNEEEWSRLTFMVYLNGGFVGGATEFDEADVDPRVVPEEGLAIVFSHGLRHQGAELVSGTKYVLRSDVMFRRQSHRARATRT